VRSLLFHHDGRIILDFAPRPLTGAQSDPERIVSRLSQEQIEALKEIERIACEAQLVINLCIGDAVFLNNHALLHSREGFRDEPPRTRHLIRMWLKNEDMAWSLPPPLEEGNRRIFFENDLRERWLVGVTSALALAVSENTSHLSDSPSH
jgi:Taurine catabolism dioxygenase TauD, TfdA family